MEKGDISKFPEYMAAIGHFMKLAHQIHPGYMPLAMEIGRASCRERV